MWIWFFNYLLDFTINGFHLSNQSIKLLKTYNVKALQRVFFFIAFSFLFFSVNPSAFIWNNRRKHYDLSYIPPLSKSKLGTPLYIAPHMDALSALTGYSSLLSLSLSLCVRWRLQSAYSRLFYSSSCCLWPLVYILSTHYIYAYTCINKINNHPL